MAVNMVGSSDEAADLVQESFVKFFDRSPRKMPENARAYLFAMVANAGRDYWRRENRHVRMDAVRERVDRRTPDQGAAADQELGWLASAVAQLPPKQHRVFALRRIEGLSIGEIAARTGTSPKTVENHLTVVLRKLRKALRGGSN